jgi:hypothetical protein
VGALLAAVLTARILDVAGVVDLPPMPELATAIVLALGVWELICITKTLVPLVRRRQIRTTYRKDVRLPAWVVGTTSLAEIVDVTPHGLAFESRTGCADGDRVRLETSLTDARGERHVVTLPVEVRSAQILDGGAWRVGARLLPVTRDLHELLVEFCDIVVPSEQLGRPTAALATPAASPTGARRALVGAVDAA